LTLVFVTTVFLSSYLLFAVQPMVAKFLLPSFGGTAAVWTACLVMFQTLLLAGYTYAHLLRTKLSPAAQRCTHLAVLALSLAALPPISHLAQALTTTGSPVWTLLRCLLQSIGLPFFALSATAPLLMEWFRQAAPDRPPDRLYAFSNAGSLLALLSYPFVLEPAFTRVTQARLWSGGMVLFFMMCAVTAWKSRGIPLATTTTAARTVPQPVRPSAARLPAWLWVALPACSSGLLLAVTNQISQDVTPMPLLWVAPLSVYLLTFVLCFEGPRAYVRGLFLPGCFAALLLLAWLLEDGYLQGFGVQVGGYLAVLFCGCMACHGELYRLRPVPERLTAYYLAIALGGALGGVFVALVAPALFRTLLETPLLALTLAALVTFILWRQAVRWTLGRRTLPAGPVALAGTLAVAASLAWVLRQQGNEVIHFARSFYGVYRVKESPRLLLDKVDYPQSNGVARVLLSGQIYHGLQFTNPTPAVIPTLYYCEEGGLGLAFREAPAQTNRSIGAIGLGAGTLAAYGRPGDHIQFYELSPEVLRIARRYFTYLTNSPARVDVHLGDGRVSLEAQLDQSFDVFVLDAFSGDSIPVHLLTAEAMRTYLRHLKPDGIMAFHISNSHLDLEPVVRALAHAHGLSAVIVPPLFQDPVQAKLASMWMLVSADREFLQRPVIAALLAKSPAYSNRQPLLWTDDFTSILPILH
jgi:SAM-dependent methyltransferase